MRDRLRGARNRDGSGCRAFPVGGSRRCKWHGGMSTGPVTIDGKRRRCAVGIGRRGDAMTYCSERSIVLVEHSGLIWGGYIRSYNAEICSP
jgi:hypothetical protein